MLESKNPGSSPAKASSVKRKQSEAGGMDANIASSASEAIELALARKKVDLEVKKIKKNKTERALEHLLLKFKFYPG